MDVNTQRKKNAMQEEKKFDIYYVSEKKIFFGYLMVTLNLNTIQTVKLLIMRSLGAIEKNFWLAVNFEKKENFSPLCY